MNRRGQVLFFAPALLLFFAFVLFPATETLWDSLHRHEAGRRSWVGLLYYRHALTDPRFHLSLANNVAYLLWTLLFEVAVGLVLALGLERNTRLNHWLRVAFFAPSVLSMVVIGLVFGFLFKDGIGVWPGMFREGRAVLTISVISGWAACGFFMVIFLAGLAGIPEEVLEAARLDGARGWTRFRRLQLPHLREVLGVALLICFTGAFKAFDLFWVLVPNQDHSSLVATRLVQEVIKFDNRGYGSTLAVLLTVLVLLVTAAVLGVRRWAGRSPARSPGGRPAEGFPGSRP